MRWSTEKTLQLYFLVRKNPTNLDWSNISKLLGIPAKKCSSKYYDCIKKRHTPVSKWTIKEDEKLKKMVSDFEINYKYFGISKWSTIASNLWPKNTKQCIYRWHKIKNREPKRMWSFKEDEYVIRYILGKCMNLGKSVNCRHDNGVFVDEILTHALPFLHSFIERPTSAIQARFLNCLDPRKADYSIPSIVKKDWTKIKSWVHLWKIYKKLYPTSNYTLNQVRLRFLGEHWETLHRRVPWTEAEDLLLCSLVNKKLPPSKKTLGTENWKKISSEFVHIVLKRKRYSNTQNFRSFDLSQCHLRTFHQCKYRWEKVLSTTTHSYCVTRPCQSDNRKKGKMTP
jgi:hypothetical protein